jgi:hypothetical protein
MVLTSQMLTSSTLNSMVPTSQRLTSQRLTSILLTSQMLIFPNQSTQNTRVGLGRILDSMLCLLNIAKALPTISWLKLTKTYTTIVNYRVLFNKRQKYDLLYKYIFSYYYGLFFVTKEDFYLHYYYIIIASK